MGQQEIFFGANEKACMAFCAVLWYTAYILKREARMKKLFVWIVAASLLLSGCKAVEKETSGSEPTSDGALLLTDGNSFEYAPEPRSADEATLRKAHPEAFQMDASKGLDVIVWQMAGELYSFGILEHTETPRDWLDPELMKLWGFSADEMRTVLAAYGANEADVTIVPWQNPISSYLPDYLIVQEGEDPEAKRQAYIEGVRALLFGDRS